MESEQFVVIGAGLAGAATAWRLAGAGHPVTLVERRKPAADDGSSHGSARIVRQTYADPFYARMVGQARELFDELEAVSGTQLITPTASLDYGSARDPHRLKGTLDEIGVANQVLSPQEAHDTWPGIRFDTEVLLHHGMGVLDAETTVDVMVRLAQEAGAAVVTGTEIERVEKSRDRYLAVTESGEELPATRLVVAVGGWLPAFLDQLPLPQQYRRLLPAFRVSQEQALHFPYRDDQQGSSTVWPTFIHHRPGMEVYSLPGGRDADFRGQKLAQFNSGKTIRSAAEQDGVLDQDNIAALTAYVQEFLPGLVPVPYAETTCLFTSTPSEDFLIDTVDGVTVVSPCSGHGAKFAPLIGQIAAEVAAGGAPPQRFTAEHLSRLASANVANHG